MSAGLIFWAIMTIIHIPILIGPVIYWRCRKYNPMKNRRPVLFTFCFVFLSLEVYVQIIIAGAWDFIGVWVDVFVGSGVMICVLEGYLIFTLSLYISYNKSKDQLAIFNMSPSQNSIKELQSFMKSVKRLNYLLGDQFAFIWIISNVTVIEIIAVVAALPDSSKLNYSMKEYNSSGDGSFRSIQNVVLGRCLITALALLVVSWRLRIVNDAFKTKSMLKRVGLGTFLGIAFFEATASIISSISDFGLSQLINVCIIDYIIAVCYWIPMYKLGKGGQASATNDTKQHELERFLRTEKGFAAFKAHLMKEFSVENLLFWSDVQKFKASCTGDSQMTSSTLQIANDIYHKYLAEEAPLEVNLPSELIKQFRQEIFVLSLDGSTINSNTFDKAAFQILELMKVDSLKRFLLTNPPSWSEFQEENSDRPISVLLSTANKELQSQITNTYSLKGLAIN